MAELFSPLVHRALQVAAHAHRRQTRKGSSDIPYISHPAMVALLLQRAGFDDDTILAAAILHDVVEDTDVLLADIARNFGAEVAHLVDCVTETKCDASGRPIPWEARKEEKHQKVARGPTAAKAIALADKLHNLQSTLLDLRAGQDVWSRFKAPKKTWLANIAHGVDICDGDEPGLRELARACRKVLDELATV